MTGAADIRVRVAEVEAVTPTIRRLRLVASSGEPLPEFSGGAHTVLSMSDGVRLIRNPYSLMGSPFEPASYEISVLRVPQSRGGSSFVHDQLHVGSEIAISPPVNLFPLDRRGRKHILLAGGIGITPFMAMTAELEREGGHFELHYGMRSRDHGAYWGDLAKRHGHRLHTYFDNEKQTIPLTRLLDGQPLGTHIYVCGPGPMIDWVLEQARLAGWPEENVHCERFSAPPTGRPFTVDLARSRRTIKVGASESVLEAIEAAGIDARCLCRGGACGECETRVLEADGAIQHNDHVLSEADKASGKKIMICVSRFEGARLVLDL
ncbi:MAG: PDR/VanB family oxidoreductase [Hyphomicrobium sp.]|jgi:ferredoxin-NADP reductase